MALNKANSTAILVNGEVAALEKIESTN